jgi:hypothetical protein
MRMASVRQGCGGEIIRKYTHIYVIHTLYSAQGLAFIFKNKTVRGRSKLPDK